MKVIPVAGHDSMLLNLSGAHGPYFIRNLVILTDTAGHTGVGEVPGGERIRQTLEDARALVIGYILYLTNSYKGALWYVAANAALAIFAYVFVVGEIKRVELRTV